MRVDDFSIGKIILDGQVYYQDIVISMNRLVEPRRNESSQKLKTRYGHTPLTTAENIPWNCKTLVIGTGVRGCLPILEEIRSRAQEMRIQLITKRTPEAIKHINDPHTNLVLHITC